MFVKKKKKGGGDGVATYVSCEGKAQCGVEQGMGSTLCADCHDAFILNRTKFL